jgi:hypothetical protein
MLGAIITVLGVAATAGATKPNPEHKITLCHRTGSYSNPYVVITVDIASVKFEGHDGHNGPVFFPNIPKHQKWGDIIPPFDFGSNGSYPGKNWIAAGMAHLRPPMHSRHSDDDHYTGIHHSVLERALFDHTVFDVPVLDHPVVDHTVFDHPGIEHSRFEHTGINHSGFEHHWFVDRGHKHYDRRTNDLRDSRRDRGDRNHGRDRSPARLHWRQGLGPRATRCRDDTCRNCDPRSPTRRGPRDIATRAHPVGARANGGASAHACVVEDAAKGPFRWR